VEDDSENAALEANESRVSEPDDVRGPGRRHLCVCEGKEGGGDEPPPTRAPRGRAAGRSPLFELAVVSEPRRRCLGLAVALAWHLIVVGLAVSFECRRHSKRGGGWRAATGFRVRWIIGAVVFGRDAISLDHPLRLQARLRSCAGILTRFPRFSAIRRCRENCVELVVAAAGLAADESALCRKSPGEIDGRLKVCWHVESLSEKRRTNESGGSGGLMESHH